MAGSRIIRGACLRCGVTNQAWHGAEVTNLMQQRTVFCLLLALTTLAVPRAAHAEYPSKRITLVVPFAAGGSNDILARAIGQKLSEALHVPVVVENQVGAS